jgi:hypothetical protein
MGYGMEPTESQSERVNCDRRREGGTWLPIFLGVLGGVVAWMLCGGFETPAFYRLSVAVFHEKSPKVLFATPGYRVFQDVILLAFLALGGLIGVLFSRWHKVTAFLFLLATVLVIAFCQHLGSINYFSRY